MYNLSHNKRRRKSYNSTVSLDEHVHYGLIELEETYTDQLEYDMFADPRPYYNPEYSLFLKQAEEIFIKHAKLKAFIPSVEGIALRIIQEGADTVAESLGGADKASVKTWIYRARQDLMKKLPKDFIEELHLEKRMAPSLI